MPFEKQVFISYAHIDNEPLTPNQQGWISRFHLSLSAMLSMRLGRKAEIWRDVKLTGNDIFADEIVQQFPKTALLISVLTPRYVESEWCTREVQEFVKSAQTTGGVLVDNKSRALKIIKIPVDNENHLPDVMKMALGYPFYILDEQQTPLELDPAYGEDFTQKFNLKLAKLAFDIAELIRKMEAQAGSGAAPGEKVVEKPAVFVADCSIDHREDREAVIADLRLQGYSTLADTQLPTDEASFLGELAAVLARCKLSVHIIGSLYGAVPDGPSEKSVAVLENELAIEYSRRFGLKRIIWVPPGIASGSPRQQQFLDQILRDPRMQIGADVITGDLEELKAAIHAALKKLETPSPPPPALQDATAANTRLVYVVCNERDRKATIPLRKFLKGQGLESNIPLFEGDAATVRHSNQDLLAACDAVIVFYGAGDEAWKRSVDAEVRKSSGYRSGKPPLTLFTYLAEPSTADKTDLVDLDEPRLLNCLQGFSEAAMAEFMSSIAGKAAS